MIKILTWNMDAWKRTPDQRIAGMEYILYTAKPDIALVQEFYPTIRYPEQYDVHYHKFPQKLDWGSAIIVRKYPHFAHYFGSKYEGAAGLLCYDFQLPDEKPLTIINIYGKIDHDGFVTTTMHNMLSDLTPILSRKKATRRVVLGGDLNVSLQWDEKYKERDPLHKLVFDRLENFGLVNCTREFFGTHVKTNVHQGRTYPWQNDYLFISRNLKPALTHVSVHSSPDMLQLSDHFPVEIELDV